METQGAIKNIPGVTDVLSIANAYSIEKDTVNTKFIAKKLFLKKHVKNFAVNFYYSIFVI